MHNKRKKNRYISISSYFFSSDEEKKKKNWRFFSLSRTRARARSPSPLQTKEDTKKLLFLLTVISYCSTSFIIYRSSCCVCVCLRVLSCHCIRWDSVCNMHDVSHSTWGIYEKKKERKRVKYRHSPLRHLLIAITNHEQHTAQ